MNHLELYQSGPAIASLDGWNREDLIRATGDRRPVSLGFRCHHCARPIRKWTARRRYFGTRHALFMCRCTFATNVAHAAPNADTWRAFVQIGQRVGCVAFALPLPPKAYGTN